MKPQETLPTMVDDAPGQGAAVHTHTMAAGDLVCVFRPEQGMICTSLKHRGEEILRLVDDMEEAVASGRSVGVPFLYPWSNRLRGTHYEFNGRVVELDPDSPWLLKDWNGILCHGVPWPRLEWSVLEATDRLLRARLPWSRPELLQVFPFEHEVVMSALLDGLGLTIETVIVATGRDRVPVSFGFHPNVGLPGLQRSQWRLSLPPMQGIVLDALLLPVGERTDLPAYDDRLAGLAFDHGFAFVTDKPSMSITGNGRCVSLDFLTGYPFAQIYAQPGMDHIALEPMTAPADALVTGEHLPVVEPGERFSATFRLRVEATDPSLH